MIDNATERVILTNCNEWKKCSSNNMASYLMTSSSFATLWKTSNTQMIPSKDKTSSNSAMKHHASKRENVSLTELKKGKNLINKGTKKIKKNISTIIFVSNH